MIENLMLVQLPNGHFLLGIPIPQGFLPVLPFPSIGEVRKFALGLLGGCDHFSTPIPQAFIEAFKEE